MGLTGATDWIQPIVTLRTSYRIVNGRDMSYTFPRLESKWILVAEGPSPYITTRRKLDVLRTGIGDSNGEAYTLHSPENLFPAAESQMSFDQREMAIIGHWSSPSLMPERYDCSVCAIELLLRNTIVREIVDGWWRAPAYRLPATVAGHVRIGKTTTLDTPVDPAIAKQGIELGTVGVIPTCGALARNDRPLDKDDDCLQANALGEVEGTQSTASGAPELTTAQNDTQLQPENDVSALGAPASGNPNF